MGKAIMDILLTAGAVLAGLAIGLTCLIGLVVWLAGGRRPAE